MSHSESQQFPNAHSPLLWTDNVRMNEFLPFSNESTKSYQDSQSLLSEAINFALSHYTIYY